jgi:hypothetical protein
MQTRALDLRFKGDRRYLHGTDVYDASLAALRDCFPGAGGRVRYSFHAIARTALELRCGKAGGIGERPEGCAAEIHLGEGDGAVSGWIVETGRTVEGCVPYDEDAIGAACALEGSRIALREPTGHRPIEIAIAMTKRLHYALFPPSSGKWMFTRLDIARPLAPGDAAGMTIVHKNRLGARLSRCDLAASGASLGSIYFSLVDA